MRRKAVVVSFLTVLVNHCVQAMFTCGLKETHGGEIPLRDTSAQSLRLLLDYMYCGELPLTNNNIQGVAVAAFLLHVDGGFRCGETDRGVIGKGAKVQVLCLRSTLLVFTEVRLCQSHMEACMDPSNCVGLYHWARNLGATSLADCALRYLCQHFSQVGFKYYQCERIPQS